VPAHGSERRARPLFILFRLPELLGGMPNPPLSGHELGSASTDHGHRRADRRQPPQRAEKHRAEDGRGQAGVEPECSPTRARRSPNGGSRGGPRAFRGVSDGAAGGAGAHGHPRGVARRGGGGRGLAASPRGARGGGALQPRGTLGRGTRAAHSRAPRPAALRDGGPPTLLPCSLDAGAGAAFEGMVFAEGTQFGARRRGASPWRRWRLSSSPDPVGSRKNQPKMPSIERKSRQARAHRARIPTIEAREGRGRRAQPLPRHPILFS
jgi:hypothetical protein